MKSKSNNLFCLLELAQTMHQAPNQLTRVLLKYWNGSLTNKFYMRSTCAVRLAGIRYTHHCHWTWTVSSNFCLQMKTVLVIFVRSGSEPHHPSCALHSQPWMSAWISGLRKCSLKASSPNCSTSIWATIKRRWRRTGLYCLRTL